MAVAVIIQVVLIFLNAVFASAEIAVISTNANKLKKLKEEGNKKAAILLSLSEQPAKFLSTIQVAITLAGLLGSAFAADNFAKPLVDLILSTGLKISEDVLHTICVIVITLILSYFNIVLGELVPKRLAMKNAEKTALGMSRMLKTVSVIFAPLVWLLTVSTNLLLRLFGVKAGEDEEIVTQDEILLMAEAGKKTGTIDNDENQLIRNVFEFKENTAGEACTHRKDADILYMKDSDEVWEKIIHDTKHTYYPICGERVDDVIGILNTKSYYRLDDKSRKNIMKKAVDKAVFVPESMTANTLFSKMKSTREFIAVVVDEYGGMRGIITLHDLVELFVGDLTEKGEEEDYKIEKLSDDEYLISGLAPMDEVVEAIGLKIDEKEVDEYDVFSGYVCNILGEVPLDGTTASGENEYIQVDVLKVDQHRIEKVKVKLKNEENNQD